MKRDMDLVRKILFEIEKSPTAYAPNELTVEGHEPQEISYHIHLMIQAGLIEGSVDESIGMGDMIHAEADKLTWWGHEFLDAARDESRWEKAKSMILQKGGGLSIDILKMVLTELLKKSIL